MCPRLRIPKKGKDTPSFHGRRILRRHQECSGWRAIEERELDGETWEARRQFVFGGLYLDEVLLFDKDSDDDGDCAEGEGNGSTRLMYASNNNFNVTALTDATGAVVEKVKYDPYGQPTCTRTSDSDVTTASHFGNPFLFQGQRFDSETGLYYFKNRDYEPNLGRFVQRDPLGYMGSMGLHELTYSRPIQLRDPLGLDPQPPVKPDGYDQFVGAWHYHQSYQEAYDNHPEWGQAYEQYESELAAYERWQAEHRDPDENLGIEARAPSDGCPQRCIQLRDDAIRDIKQLLEFNRMSMLVAHEQQFNQDIRNVGAGIRFVGHATLGVVCVPAGIVTGAIDLVISCFSDPDAEHRRAQTELYANIAKSRTHISTTVREYEKHDCDKCCGWGYAPKWNRQMSLWH